jgi:hypothetical protein
MWRQQPTGAQQRWRELTRDGSAMIGMETVGKNLENEEIRLGKKDVGMAPSY